MEENKKKSNIEIEKITNTCILELSSETGDKVVVPVIKVANLVKLMKGVYAFADNTCKQHRAFIDPLDPVKAMKRFEPIGEEESRKLLLKNEQISTFFGFPNDLFTKLYSVFTKNDMVNIIKFIEEHLDKDTKMLKAFYFGRNDNDFFGVDFNKENNIIDIFLRYAKDDLHRKRDDEKKTFPCRSFKTKVTYQEDIGLPPQKAEKKFLTAIDAKDAIQKERNSEGKFIVCTDKPQFLKNLERILCPYPCVKSLEISDFDFISKYMNYDKFSTKLGGFSEKYFTILEYSVNGKPKFCEGAEVLINGILNSDNYKALGNKGIKIGRGYINDALMDLSSAGCESTLCYSKDGKDGEIEFLNGIKGALVAKHSNNIASKIPEYFLWEPELINRISKSNNIYSISNYWQSVVMSVFFKYRSSNSGIRKKIYSNFLDLYYDIKAGRFIIENHISPNCKCKTQILINKLIDGIAVSLDDLKDISNFIVGNWQLLEFSDAVTQVIYLDGMNFSNRFEDTFLIYKGELVAQIPKLVSKFLKHCQVGKNGIGVDDFFHCCDFSSLVGPEKILNGEIKEILEFTFCDDGLPYIRGITKLSFEKFFNNFRFYYCSIRITRLYENTRKYLLRLKNKMVSFEVQYYMANIFLLLAQKDHDQLSYITGICPKNFWDKFEFVDACFSETNKIDISNEEKIKLIIEITGHLSIENMETVICKLYKLIMSCCASKEMEYSCVTYFFDSVFDFYTEQLNPTKLTNKQDGKHNFFEIMFGEILMKKLYSDDDKVLKLFY